VTLATARDELRRRISELRRQTTGCGTRGVD